MDSDNTAAIRSGILEQRAIFDPSFEGDENASSLSESQMSSTRRFSSPILPTLSQTNMTDDSEWDNILDSLRTQRNSTNTNTNINTSAINITETNSAENSRVYPKQIHQSPFHHQEKPESASSAMDTSPQQRSFTSSKTLFVSGEVNQSNGKQGVSEEVNVVPKPTSKSNLVGRPKQFSWREANFMMRGNTILCVVMNDYTPLGESDREDEKFEGNEDETADGFVDNGSSPGSKRKSAREEDRPVLITTERNGSAAGHITISFNESYEEPLRALQRELEKKILIKTKSRSASTVTSPDKDRKDNILARGEGIQSPTRGKNEAANKSLLDSYNLSSSINSTDSPTRSQSSQENLHQSLTMRTITEDQKDDESGSAQEVPDWITEMRRAWDSEIEFINPETRSLSWRDNRSSSRRNSWISSLFSKTPDNETLSVVPKDKIENTFAKYTYVTSKRDIVKKDLLSQEDTLLKQVSPEMSIYRRYHRNELISVCRKIAHHKLARIRLQQDMENRYISCLKEQIDIMAEFFRSGSINYYGSKIPDPLQLSQSDPFIRKNAIALKNVDMRIRDLEELWNTLTRRISPLTEEYVKRILLEILSNTQTYANMLYHEQDDNLQHYFERIFLDERTTEGKKLTKYIRTLNGKNSKDVSPQEVANFIQYYAEEVALKYGVQDRRDVSTLSIYMSRMIHPRLQGLYKQFSMEKDRQNDIKYSRIIRQLRMESLDRFSLNPKFLPSTGSLLDYVAPVVYSLENMGFSMIPIDMAHIVLKSGKKLTLTVQRLSSKATSNLGADDIFPFFVYCVVHAEIPNIHSNLRYMEQLLPTGASMTEHGYWLTSLRAAVSHIMSCDDS